MIGKKSDEEIVKQVQSGDTQAFGFLIERYEKKIMRYARKFLSGHEDIQDIVQNVFIKTYQNIQGFDVKKRFSPWIYRIAHNEFVNALKRRNKKLSFSLNLDTFMPFLVSRHNIQQEVEDQKTYQILDENLNRLDSKHKEPLILYYFQNLSYKEISDVLRIPVSTVGVRIKRAKNILRSFYL